MLYNCHVLTVKQIALKIAIATSSLGPKGVMIAMRLLRLPEAADRLGLKVSTLRFWIWQRKIETVRVGRAVRIREDSINRLIEEGTMPARESR
jgi:excisionase family DNA binding protein